MHAALKNKTGARRCLVLIKVRALIGVFALIASSCFHPKSSTQSYDLQPIVEQIAFRKIEQLDVFQYTITSAGDTIQYIKVGIDTTAAKPTIIFL